MSFIFAFTSFCRYFCVPNVGQVPSLAMTIPRTTQNFCQRTTVSEDMDTGIYRHFGEVVGNQYSRRENYTAEDREVMPENRLGTGGEGP